ncbi:hypothetical protein GCM10011506_06460 [Marivirga lumbricoides]|uniref:Uncharacterized protein n=1 Tax=Marivirga lumbricoides TaxID=1046115 RepID=A0ABQ1LGC5_9BACT|nr:hypothetical protein GCM10011506_06460 [Marivirga lumbricoides]
MSQDDLNKQIDSLNETIQGLKSYNELQDRLEKQVKDHKEYLEGLFNKTVRILYVIAGFLIGITGILGIKTYWDIETKLKDYADKRIEKVISEDHITESVEKQVLEYSKGALIHYLSIISIDKSDFKLSASELSVIELEINSLETQYFGDLQTIIRNFQYFKEEGKEKFGGILKAQLSLALEKDEFEEKSIELLHSLSILDYKTGMNDFLFIVNDNSYSNELQKKYIELIPNLIRDNNDKVEILKALKRDLRTLRDENSEVYIKRTLAIFQISNSEGIDILIGLADLLDKKKYIELYLDIIEGVMSNTRESRFLRGSRNPFDARDKQVIKPLFLSEKVYFSFSPSDHFRHGIGRYGQESKPSISLMINDDDGSGASGGGWERFIDNDWLLRILGEVYSEIETNSSKLRYLKGIIIPISTYYMYYFEYEKTTGVIGPNANRVDWQDGFYLSLTNGTSKSILTGIEEGNFTSIEKNKTNGIDRKIIPISDVQGFRWASRSNRLRNRYY